MKQIVFACVVLVLFCSAARAGVVIEMEATTPGSTDQAVIETIYAQGEMLRIDPHAGEASAKNSVIFRDNTLWILDHNKKAAQKIDKQGMEQLGGVMKQMEAELAKLPPEQRAVVEQMMKGKMQGGMAGMGQEASPQRLEVGAVETVGDYSCVTHTLYSGEAKAWEVCAAEDPGDAEEAMEAFAAVGRFTEGMREAAQQGPFGSMINSPFLDLERVGGLPVRVRTFENGRLSTEATLQSMTRQDVEAAVFSIPDTYKVTDMAAQIPRGR